MNTFKTLRRRYGRTSLTVTGVALAIAFSTIMLSIGEAIQNSGQEILDETGVDLIIEPVEFAPLIQEFIPIFEINNGRTILNAMLDNNSKIRAAAPWLIKNLFIAKKPDEINASKPPMFALAACKGTIPESNRYFGGLELKGEHFPSRTDPFYANGTYDGGTDSNNFTHEILISEPMAKMLKVSIGETIYLNPFGLYTEYTNESLAEWFENATWFKIYGIINEKFESQNALTAHMHLSELQYLTGEHVTDSISKIYLKLHKESDRDEVKHWLETEFIYKDQITVYTPDDLIKDLRNFLKLFEGFSSMVTIITILVATLFISTVLMISTRERTREIGALRAIGISKVTINKFIFKESFVICMLGLVIGLILGAVGAEILNDYLLSTEPFLPAEFRIAEITPILIGRVTAITIAIALLASIAPSYWASKLKPADTLRSE